MKTETTKVTAPKLTKAQREALDLSGACELLTIIVGLEKNGGTGSAGIDANGDAYFFDENDWYVLAVFAAAGLVFPLNVSDADGATWYPTDAGRAALKDGAK